MTSDALNAGLPPASDRMLTTCFLAALAHAIVILGVTFSAPDADPDKGAGQSLEVVLVGDQTPAAARNPTAQYLAERSHVGAGTSLSVERATIPKSSPVQIDRPGLANADGTEMRQSGTDAGESPLLASRGPASRIVYFATAADADAAAEMPLRLEKRPSLEMTANDDGVELRLRGERRHQLWIAADTRESDVAAYLDRWRHKVERVGTLNFPSAARRQKLSGTPVVEVTIAADGRMARAQIRRSSGHAEIDYAAIRILKLAAPFDRFPADLARKHDEIRIAYEWQFLGGAAGPSSVFVTQAGAPQDHP